MRMSCSPLRRPVTLLVAACVLGLGACDFSDESGEREQGQGPTSPPQRGGTLTVLADGDVDFIDPGLSVKR